MSCSTTSKTITKKGDLIYLLITETGRWVLSSMWSDGLKIKRWPQQYEGQFSSLFARSTTWILEIVYTIFTMPTREVITAETGIKTPLLSQAIKYGDTIYVSGNVGMDFTTNKMAEGNVADRTVSCTYSKMANAHNGHSVKLSRTSKPFSRKLAPRWITCWRWFGFGIEVFASQFSQEQVNIYLTSMQDYAAMNKTYLELIPDPKPARTCVAVAELPMGTDVRGKHGTFLQTLIDWHSRLRSNVPPICEYVAAVSSVRRRK